MVPYLWCLRPVLLFPGRPRQGDLCESEANVFYILSSRSARDSYADPVSKNQKSVICWGYSLVVGYADKKTNHLPQLQQYHSAVLFQSNLFYPVLCFSIGIIGSAFLQRNSSRILIVRTTNLQMNLGRQNTISILSLPTH